MEESKNLFKYDNPIGRKKFIIDYLKIMLISLLFVIPIGIMKYIGLNVITQPIVFILWGANFILSMYLSIILFSKRIWDLGCDKKKALLYIILFFIANNAIGSIQATKYVSLGLGILLLLVSLFKKGNLHSKINEDEKVEE